MKLGEIMTESTKPIEKSNTNDFPKSSRFYNIFISVIILIIGCVSLIITFVLPPNPYVLYNVFWYTDFRYWSDWISGCCRLVLLWSVVSTLLALVIPKNESRIFLLRRSFFQKIIGLLFLFLIFGFVEVKVIVPK